MFAGSAFTHIILPCCYFSIVQLWLVLGALDKHLFKKDEKRIVETEVLREKPQSIANKSR